ncbi:PTS transporter subunit EIIC [Klebsiella pneumoniae subsp. pneumoniae]|nr:PTS transporter subunit EIIC [Klebsiella pneumoniae subsp. pneumoniae]
MPIISVWPIFTGVILSFHLATDRLRDPGLLPVGCLSEPSGGVWYLRFIERCLVPFGLHHIWNVPFQMQIGEYTNARLVRVFHGDIPRYMAGDPTAGKLSGGFLFKMYGLPAAAIAIWHSA